MSKKERDKRHRKVRNSPRLKKQKKRKIKQVEAGKKPKRREGRKQSRKNQLHLPVLHQMTILIVLAAHLNHQSSQRDNQ